MDNTIYLTQGDDSDAMGKKYLLKIESEVDLTGFSAIFQLRHFQQKFNDISKKEVNVVIPSSVSALFPIGPANAAIKVFDTDGKQVTVARDIKFYILPKVVDNV